MPIRPATTIAKPAAEMLDMRKIILLSILAGAGLALLGYFVWLVLRAVYDLYRDWRLKHELGTLESAVAAWKSRREQANQHRPATGCAHQFEQGSRSSVRQVCRFCGREAERTSLQCDHVWRRVDARIPRSACDTCGQEIDGLWGLPQQNDEPRMETANDPAPEGR